MLTPVPLEELGSNPALARQLELLTRLSSVLHDDTTCLGAAVGGSLAAGTADELSDVDLVVYCQEGEARRVLAYLSAKAADRPVIHRYRGNHDNVSLYEKVILDDWFSYELHVIEPSTRMRLRPPYVELLNREGYLQFRISFDKPIGRDTARPYAGGSDGLTWELFNCIKWLRRGDVEFTEQYIERLGTALRSRASESPA